MPERAYSEPLSGIFHYQAGELADKWYQMTVFDDNAGIWQPVVDDLNAAFAE